MEDEILEITFRKDRFFVKVKLCNGAIKTFPRYVYNWLKHNPSFKSIPKGYLIHHLDHEKTNDDPSNLVLMLIGISLQIVITFIIVNWMKRENLLQKEYGEIKKVILFLQRSKQWMFAIK